MSELSLRVGGATDVGRSRSANEDAFLCDDDRLLYAVADGMGGHRAGEVASSTALEAVSDRAVDGTPLDEAIRDANTVVFEKAQANPDMRGMGTTLTAMQIVEGTARIAHVGDSRAYLLRDGQLTRVTDDHSLVEELVREGRLTPDQAAVHPQRSVITRALGIDDDVVVDTYEVELRSGDRLLLCSDGLTSMLRDDRILDLLRRTADPQTAADALVEAANAAGGDDNITVVVVDVEGDGDRSATMAASAAVRETTGAPTGEWERADGADGSGRRGRRERRARGGGRRLSIGRLVLYAFPILLVIGIAVGILGWYARSTYFVGLEGEREQVVLYKGVPGGFFLWDPTVEAVTRLDARDLTQNQRADLDDGHRFSDRADAEAFLRRLNRRVEDRRAATTTTEATTSTTDAADEPPTTTTQ
ncbi:MAG TPA: Stp1/IreP family PP2C-type Ser/Thr phosphatase [Acidimicrobiia bacterium]|nr:Stp1/IreP family PP2C-type Ser/Thr phosphatase [Acidimicrobiia bacterium]